MTIRTWAAALALCAVAAPSWAINKCINEWGRPVFQDAPCPQGRGGAIEVRPAAGPALAPPPAPPRAGASQAAAAASASAPAPMTEAQRIEAQIAQSQRERRRRDLQERIVPVAESQLLEHRAACKARQEALERSQHAYVQNLWGKTHSAQMASEMAANAAMCDTKERELKEALDVARRECVQLGGCR